MLVNCRNLIFLSMAALLVGSCQKGPTTSDSATASPNPNTDTSQTSSSWYGGLSGQILPKEGASATTAVNVKVEVVSHPELSTTTDSDGKYTVKNVQPGNYSLMLSSAVLTGQKPVQRNVSIYDTGSTYGLKMDNIVVESGKTKGMETATLKKNGKISGTIDFFTNPNNLDLTGTDVYIPGTSYIVKTAADGSFVMNGVPPGDYTLRAEHTGFVHTDFDLTVAEDSTTSSGKHYLSISDGPEGTINIVGGQSTSITQGNFPTVFSVVTSRSVVVTMTYDSNTALMKVADESAFLNKQWITAAGTYNFTFSSDGIKRMFVKFSDLNGLESSPYYVDFIVDTEGPVLTSATILNGWEVVANNLQIPIAVETEDTGTGIKEIMFSNTCATFAGEICASISGSWVEFTNPALWDLTSGDGVKTVYVKVRDYMNRESSIVSDSINKSSYTQIYASTYSTPVLLRKQQSPYLIPDDTTFEDTVTIEPGVIVTLTNAKEITFKGKVMAVGSVTSGNSITFSSEGGGCDGTTASMDMSLGNPGVSTTSSFDYVTFKGQFNLTLNGGTFNHSYFNSSCTSTSAMGSIEKKRTDILKIKNSLFNHWSEIKVSDGNGNTELNGNSGSLATFLNQTGTASNTVVVNNTNIDAFQNVYQVSNGTLSPTGTTVTGACNSAYNFPGSGISTGEVITINDASPPPCSYVYGGFALSNAVYNISNSVVSGCSVFSAFQGSAGATVNFSNVTANCGTISLQNGGMALNFIDSHVTASSMLVKCDFMGSECNSAFSKTSSGSSSIACSHSTNGSYCDLFYRVAQGPSVSMSDSLSITNSTISCGNRCRGFSYVEPSNVDQSSNTKTAAFTLTLSGNTWTYPNGETQRRPTSGTNWTSGGVLGVDTASFATSVPTANWLYSFRNTGSNKYITVNPSVNYLDGN